MSKTSGKKFVVEFRLKTYPSTAKKTDIKRSKWNLLFNLVWQNIHFFHFRAFRVSNWFSRLTLFGFVFSRRFLTKSAWLIQGLVSLFFFRQTTERTLYVPLFDTEVNRFMGNPTVAGSSPCFSQKRLRAFGKPDRTKGSPFNFFSDFLDKFSMSSKGPFIFSWRFRSAYSTTVGSF